MNIIKALFADWFGIRNTQSKLNEVIEPHDDIRMRKNAKSVLTGLLPWTFNLQNCSKDVRKRFYKMATEELIHQRKLNGNQCDAVLVLLSVKALSNDFSKTWTRI